MKKDQSSLQQDEPQVDEHNSQDSNHIAIEPPGH